MVALKERTRLILARRLNEAVWIGDAKVTLERTHGRKGFRFVIEAPEDVKVLRAELVDEQEGEGDSGR